MPRPKHPPNDGRVYRSTRYSEDSAASGHRERLVGPPKHAERSLSHFHSRPPLNSFDAQEALPTRDIGAPSSLCRCQTCYHIHSTNFALRSSDGRSPRTTRTLGVLLVGAVDGGPAVLLGRKDGETQYGLTAGPSYFTKGDFGCYERAAFRILVSDANIKSTHSSEHVTFLAVRRLENGTPVLIGKAGDLALRDMDDASDFFEASSTKLFRVGGSGQWRVAGTQNKFRTVQESVKVVLMSLPMGYLMDKEYSKRCL